MMSFVETFELETNTHMAEHMHDLHGPELLQQTSAQTLLGVY